MVASNIYSKFVLKIWGINSWIYSGSYWSCHLAELSETLPKYFLFLGTCMQNPFGKGTWNVCRKHQ